MKVVELQIEELHGVRALGPRHHHPQLLLELVSLQLQTLLRSEQCVCEVVSLTLHLINVIGSWNLFFELS